MTTFDYQDRAVEIRPCLSLRPYLDVYDVCIDGVWSADLIAGQETAIALAKEIIVGKHPRVGPLITQDSRHPLSPMGIQIVKYLHS